MKGLYLPLFAITCTVAVTGIEVFQTTSDQPPGMKTAELIFVILLFVLIGLGIVISYQRNKAIKQGFSVDDELSTKMIRLSATTTFFISLVLWLAILILNAHTSLTPKYLTGLGIMGMCLVFLIVWAANSHIKYND